MKITAGDNSIRLPISKKRDELDAISHAINVVVDELNEETKSANRSVLEKSRFLANVSHEIRTPLTAVVGYSNLLSEQNLPQDILAKYIDHIQENCSHLLMLIDSLLDLSKIESGELKFNHNQVNLNKLIQEISAYSEMKCKEKGLGFELDSEISEDQLVEIDKVKFKQIVLNLLNNSIKYTEKGKVILRVFKSTTANAQDNLILEVQDTGLGISKKLTEKLFRPFQRRQNEINTKYGGVGLGLNISRSLAQFMGGDVVLQESTEGEGSTFKFFIPVRWVKVKIKNYQGSVPKLKIKGKNILLVEDNLELSTLFEIYLNKEGALVMVANDGQQATALVNKKEFDIILMDIEMPILDGIETTKILRKNGCKIPIVAVTAHDIHIKKDQCIKAGANSILSKPITKKELISHLLEVLTHHGQ